MTLRLNGATSGFTEIDAPAVAGSNTLILPGGNGSADQALVTNGSGTLSFADRGRMVLETAKAYNWNGLTTNTSLDFTSIPSWVKRVTVMFSGVSTNGSSDLLVQIGAGLVTTSGYVSTSVSVATSNATSGASSTAGFNISNGGASYIFHGQMVLTTLGTNIWTSGHLVRLLTTNTQNGAGGVTLGGTLDRVRITTVNGTDTFDAGTINLLLEG